MDTYKKEIAFPAHRVACLKDRIIASMLDLSFLSLLFLLLLAPIKRQMLIFQLTDQDQFFFMIFVLAFAILTLAGLLYRVLSTIILKGSTPGKFLLNLKVVDIWSNQPLSIVKTIVREFFWILNTTLFCVPHLGIFAHEQRRPLHDRIADSIVISTKGRFANRPTYLEHIFCTGVIFAFSCCVCFGFVFYYYKAGLQNINKKNLLELLSSHKEVCENVSEAEAQWSYLDEVEDLSRLEIALTLHGGYLIDDECLDKEVQNAFKNNENLDLAYLGNAFITSNNSKLSDEYLKKTCQIAPDSQACLLSQIVLLWTEKQWDEASQKFHSIDSLQASPFIKVWAIKHFERVKAFQDEIETIEQLWHIKPLKNYLMSHRVAALWGLRKKSHARIAFQSALHILPQEDILSLSGWYCLQNFKDSCQSEILSDCRNFTNAIHTDPSLLENSIFSLAYIKIKTCSQKDNVDYVALADEMVEMPALQLLRSMKLIQEGSLDQAAEVLKELINEENLNNQKPSPYLEEGRELLALITKNHSEIQMLSEDWLAMNRLTWGERRLGLMLFHKSFAMNDLTLATRIGSQLHSLDPYNQKLQQKLIVASYKIGQEKRAWEFLQKLNAQNKTFQAFQDQQEDAWETYLKPQRNIATVSSLQEEFQNISKSLTSQFKTE